uniref:Uncharacterized protein n=1 Tax=Arundo donax TaxID=35708 RepID=A0A0A9DJL5_ARUDO
MEMAAAAVSLTGSGTAEQELKVVAPPKEHTREAARCLRWEEGNGVPGDGFRSECPRSERWRSLGGLVA